MGRVWGPTTSFEFTTYSWKRYERNQTKMTKNNENHIFFLHVFIVRELDVELLSGQEILVAGKLMRLGIHRSNKELLVSSVLGHKYQSVEHIDMLACHQVDSGPKHGSD